MKLYPLLSTLWVGSLRITLQIISTHSCRHHAWCSFEAAAEIYNEAQTTSATVGTATGMMTTVFRRTRINQQYTREQIWSAIQTLKPSLLPSTSAESIAPTSGKHSTIPPFTSTKGSTSEIVSDHHTNTCTHIETANNCVAYIVHNSWSYM